MIVVGLHLHVQCSCGEDVEYTAPIQKKEAFPVKVLEAACPSCGTKFFVHIQESKTPSK